MRTLLAGLALVVVVPTFAAPQTSPPVYSVGEGITPPVVIKKINPQYTEAARKSGVQGIVTLACTIGPDGVVRDARVIKSLDSGLDAEAIKAVRRWQFEPGRKDGTPVAVRVTIEFTFSLRAQSARDSLRFLPVPPAGRANVRPVPADVYRPGKNVSAPVVKRELKPLYTPEAMHAKIQGTVEVECVVLPDGTVGDVQVTRPLDPGLDEQAVKAVKQWTFKPGLRDGKPVAVLVTIEMTFTLH